MNDIINEINRLKKEKNAVILAHNYQIPEIQDIADFVGDSLGLSQQAAKTDADVIVFCGVHFMAETASIISPDKKVLIPDPEAGCSLASTIDAEQLIAWKKEHPGAVVVSYVNTTAEVKAESDYCVTSSNAVKVVESIPKEKKILFLPDRFLGMYVSAVTGRNMEIWNGACHVHEKIGDINFDDARAKHPNAEFLIHPECGCSTSCMLKSQLYFDCKNIHIFSTEGMINYVKESDADEFVIATEVGILHRLKKIKPQSNYFPVSDESVCEYMKMITLEKLYESLLHEKYEVKVPEEIAQKARIPIDRMLSIV
ncbi:Quinolinate synthase [Melioribacter roseus P3M-2]|uniref:Quinolinate synthase n=1 Tax=Melioribacter roseus (strain DSM 23840 / JCM 17771 / VKM B-2668 / P3M-2) TaxID=1191523 RepID=I6Z4W6_MELRP|nr:quinolinate synthase NadA [Melioribacter roseus]AFN74195.1 Quinolinate synthase [Melioribacter roseus P3M-2]